MAASGGVRDRHLKPGKDIRNLKLSEFNQIIALVRPKVEVLISEACARMMPSTLKRPSLFDDAMATLFDHPNICSKADGANASAWCRAARWKEPVPETPPPAFFLPGYEGDAKSVMDHVVNTMETHRKKVMSGFQPAEFSDPGTIDDKVKDMLLTSDDCEESVTRLSKERPSVFDVVASSHRYRPADIDKVRNIMERREKGLVGEDESFYELFKIIVPNSKQIIADLQKQAMQDRLGRENRVNLE